MVVSFFLCSVVGSFIVTLHQNQEGMKTALYSASCFRRRALLI